MIFQRTLRIPRKCMFIKIVSTGRSVGCFSLECHECAIIEVCLTTVCALWILSALIAYDSLFEFGKTYTHERGGSQRNVRLRWEVTGLHSASKQL